MSPDLMVCVLVVLFAFGVAGVLGLSDEDVPYKPPSRYESERVETECYGLEVQVVTDTQTGKRWMVAESHNGGVAIEPMNGRD